MRDVIDEVKSPNSTATVLAGMSRTSCVLVVQVGQFLGIPYISWCTYWLHFTHCSLGHDSWYNVFLKGNFAVCFLYACVLLCNMARTYTTTAYRNSSKNIKNCAIWSGAIHYIFHSCQIRWKFYSAGINTHLHDCIITLSYIMQRLPDGIQPEMDNVYTS